MRLDTKPRPRLRGSASHRGARRPPTAGFSQWTGRRSLLPGSTPSPQRRTKDWAGRAPRLAPEGSVPRAQPGLPGSTAAPLPGTAAFTAPAPPACGGRRPRSCCGQSAAKRRPQLGPTAGETASPIVKGPAGGSAYKASARAHAALRCQSRLAIQRGRPESSNRRPAGPRCNARRRRLLGPGQPPTASWAVGTPPPANWEPACGRTVWKGAPGKLQR